ncbi:hypothetical protein M2160_006419 [Streptomyces sp. SAI-117]|nr:hypothetical protein [Streptomyces sp. SAI-117]
MRSGEWWWGRDCAPHKVTGCASLVRTRGRPTPTGAASGGAGVLRGPGEDVHGRRGRTGGAARESGAAGPPRAETESRDTGAGRRGTSARRRGRRPGHRHRAAASSSGGEGRLWTPAPYGGGSPAVARPCEATHRPPTAPAIRTTHDPRHRRSVPAAIRTADTPRHRHPTSPTTRTPPAETPHCRIDQPRSRSAADRTGAACGSTISWTRPACCPVACSIRTSSMLTPARPASAKIRAS